MGGAGDERGGGRSLMSQARPALRCRITHQFSSGIPGKVAISPGALAGQSTSFAPVECRPRTLEHPWPLPPGASCGFPIPCWTEITPRRRFRATRPSLAGRNCASPFWVWPRQRLPRPCRFPFQSGTPASLRRPRQSSRPAFESYQTPGLQRGCSAPKTHPIA